MYLEPVFDHMHKELLKSSVIHADETYFRVLEKEGNSYIWVFSSGKTEERKICLYL